MKQRNHPISTSNHLCIASTISINPRSKAFFFLNASNCGVFSTLGNVRGKGLFWAVKFMKNPEKMVAFPMDDDFSSKVKDTALDYGVNVLCNMGFAGMLKIDTVAITPPFTITEEELV
ncbi:hypothetical protein BU16DRAFT_604794 [Lophium mytilinum]|uniref:Uncharacterized protein n=1 Tax=Lophium mytilinum TaxID=390894 RepID=A0A6A6R174_9PEZI|nr:hypothetical protein BU16DRAFT_604794 [Lophium mytilinum]